MRLPPLPTIGDVIRLYQLSAVKKLSQNFIMDMHLNEKIVKLAGNLDGCCVCEVGPGPGGITRAILNQNIKHLYVIEKDKRFFPGLQMLADASRCLTAYHGDVLRFNMDDLFPEEFVQEWADTSPKLHIIGNLPFSVSTPLIFQYMEAISNRNGAWRYGRVKMTLTFQKEVAMRMIAKENEDYRCRISPVVQNLCHVKLKYIIPGKAFVPSPDVDVGLVHFIPRKQPVIDLPYNLIVKITRCLFHHRQKICKNNFKIPQFSTSCQAKGKMRSVTSKTARIFGGLSTKLLTLFPEDQQILLDELLQESGTSPEKRPVNFTLDDIGKVCHAYDKICKRLPYIFDYDYRNPSSIQKVNEIRRLEYEMGLVGDLNSQLNTDSRVEDGSSGIITSQHGVYK